MRFITGRPTHARHIGIVAVCAAAAVIAAPALSTAKDKTMVFITNGPADAIPVAQQGTTEVKVVSPPPVQKRFRIDQTNNDCCDTTIYNVPPGKILTVEYAEIFYDYPAPLRYAELSAACSAEDEGDLELATVRLPPVPAENVTLASGTIRFQVPGGRCLRGSVSTENESVPDGVTFFVNGMINGYLTDAP